MLSKTMLQLYTHSSLVWSYVSAYTSVVLLHDRSQHGEYQYDSTLIDVANSTHGMMIDRIKCCRLSSHE